MTNFNIINFSGACIDTYFVDGDGNLSGGQEFPINTYVSTGCTADCSRIQITYTNGTWLRDYAISYIYDISDIDNWNGNKTFNVVVGANVSPHYATYPTDYMSYLIPCGVDILPWTQDWNSPYKTPDIPLRIAMADEATAIAKNVLGDHPFIYLAATQSKYDFNDPGINLYGGSNKATITLNTSVFSPPTE